jgi:endo-beta-N-acetylglucosaminidase D
MSKGLSGEEFIKHVAKIMEKQLKEWDDQYEVFLMKLVNYEFMIKNGNTYYNVELSEHELQFLQNKSPFSVDRKVWTELQNQGLPIIIGVGDYLDKVFI